MLNGDLAFLNLMRGDYEKAASIWKDVCFKYSETKWYAIDTIQICYLATCYRILKDYECLLDCLIHLISFSRDVPETGIEFTKELYDCVHSINHSKTIFM